MNVIYWGSWSHHRKGDGKFSWTDIDPTIGTHFIYAFLIANENGEITYKDPWLDINLKGIDNFIALRNKNAKAKFICSVGGWNAGSNVFSKIAKFAQSREVFAKSALAMCEKHNFDGFDLDWEYPCQQGSDERIDSSLNKKDDKENFVLLCQELHKTLTPAKKLFSIAVGACASSASLSYDVKRISKCVDYIMLMTYDYNNSKSEVTGFNAPLDFSPYDASRELNVRASVNWWKSQGAPPNKLVLGLAAYGRSFTLSNPSQNGVNAPVVGPGEAGEFKKDNHGTLSYMEICKRIRDGWKVSWDDKQKVPYAYCDNQWVGYDDPRSIDLKIQFMKKENLAGVMWWSIDDEDFRGLGGDGKFPLIRLAYEKVVR